MTITEKAKQVDLPVEKVAELASAAGIDAEDVNRTLEHPKETTVLGSAVKKYLEATDGIDTENDTVRFWTEATKHLIQAGKERITFKDNVLVLDAKEDIGTIALIRSLRNINGRYSIYEVLDEPFGEDSNDAVWFSNMLEDMVFTGHNRERSKAGMKAVRALFSPDELLKMGEGRSDPRRLVMKALRNKSLKLVSNNG